MLATTDLARALILGGLVALWAVHLASAPLLIGMAFAVGVLTVLHSAFIPAAIPDVVDQYRAPSVNGRIGSLEAAAGALGPSLASGLILVIAAPVALLVDVISYLVSGVLKLSIKTENVTRESSTDPSSVSAVDPGPPRRRARLKVDAQLHPFLRRVVVLSLANGVLLSLFLLFLTRELHLSPATYGVVLSIGAVGGILGGLLAGPVIRRLGALSTMRSACMLLGLSVAVMPSAILFGGILVPIVSEAAGSLGAVLVMVGAMTHIQTGRGNQIGRSVAVVTVVVEAGHVTGAFLGGFLAERLGVMEVLTGAALLAAVGSLACLPIFWRQRQMPSEATAGSP